MDRIARTLVAVSLAHGLAACATAVPPSASRLVAVFGIQTVKPVKIRPPRLRELGDGIEDVIAGVRGWKVVPRDSLEKAIVSTRKRSRGRAPRSCHDAPCQVRAGRSLSASHAVAVRVEGNLLGQCDVYLAIYDLTRSGRDQRAHIRAGCSDEALQLSTARALCQVLLQDAARDGIELSGTNCLAAAELTWLEAPLEAIRRARATGLDGLVALERRLAEQTLDLRRAYDKVIALAGRRWSTSALCRQGALYDAFAAALAASAEEGDPPEAIRRQGGDALASYRSQLRAAVEGKLGPLRDQARQLYDRCLTQAASPEPVETRFIAEARARSSALRQPSGRRH